MKHSDHQQGDSRLIWGAFLMGVALGGFFDGILLHQVLQWHHLLSGVAPTDTVADLRFQILADGAFHVLHYIAAILGLWLALSNNRALRSRIPSRKLLGWAAVGFGAWHWLDAVVAHWGLQLHRIRMDVQNPLFWDIGWLMLFGVLPLAAGFYLLRRKPPGDGGGPEDPRGSKGAAGALILSVLIAGPVAAVPPVNRDDENRTLVIFRPGVSFADIVAATESVDGRLIWTDKSEKVWLIAIGPDASPSALYRHGALLVGSGPVAVGCLSWTQV